MSEMIEHKGNAKENNEFEHAKHWYDLFEREFHKESDRAAVILSASIFDNSLTELLKNHLVSNPTVSDDLFDGATAPLSTFSSKITICFRLGLISSRFARDLHLVRKIRNEFAHNVQGCSFEDSSVKSRVLELFKGIADSFKNLHRARYPPGPRGDFMMVCSWMLWSINCQLEDSGKINEADIEFGYLERDPA